MVPEEGRLTEEQRLAHYRALLLEKVKRTNWNEGEEGAQRKRKLKAPYIRPKSQPRTEGERKADLEGGS